MTKQLWPHARPYAPWILAGVACSAMEADRKSTRLNSSHAL